MTGFWIAVVAHAISRFPGTGFDVLLEECPRLLDKTLIDRHYSRQTLASERARRELVPPDLVPLP